MANLANPERETPSRDDGFHTRTDSCPQATRSSSNGLSSAKLARPLSGNLIES